MNPIELSSSMDLNGYLAVQAVDFTNLTVANITSKYVPTFISNSTSVANSAFFLVYLSLVFMYAISHMVRSRKLIVRNQLVLYILLLIFIGVYLFALLFRLIYNGMGLYINLNATDKPSIIEYQKVMWASGFIENFLSFFQMIPIGIFVISFIQYVL